MNTIVQEIHESFDSAELEIVREAETILEEAEDSEKRERTDMLSEIGFVNAKPVKRLSAEEQERAEDLLHLQKRYNRIAPQYKFITRQKLIEICQKYKIIVGPSQRYTGDIPEENQKDITNFKILDDSFLEVSDPAYLEAEWKTAKGETLHPKDMSTSHIENCIKVVARKLRDTDQRGDYMSVGDVSFNRGNVVRAMFTELRLRGEEVSHLISDIQNTPLSGRNAALITKPFASTYFYVAADVNSFDTEGAKLEDNMLLDDEPDVDLDAEVRKNLFQEYDPIVMAKIQGGYLIVTAWGDEASDPDVINPTRN